MTRETSIAKLEQFQITKMDATELSETIKDNLGGEAVGTFDFDKVSVPAGGSTTWEVPALDGMEETKELTGIIIFQKTTRAFWKDSFEDSGGGTPPDCSSDDGRTGTGEPGGDCGPCPHNQFGSDGKKGKGCKECRILFMLFPENLLPVVVSVPPSSLKAMKKFMLRMTSKNVPYWKCIVKLELNRTKNSDGISYSEIVPSIVGRIPCEQIDGLKAYRENLIPSLAAVRAQDVVDRPEETTDEDCPF